MELTGNDVAGVVDLFGALTRTELGTALAELAFKHGDDHDPVAFEGDIVAAERSYHLVIVSPDRSDTGGTEPLFAVGPVAYPELPAGATDLPHILDVETRDLDREAVVNAAERRFREDASAAVDGGNAERIDKLLDVSYELEAWGGVDLTDSRARLDATS